MPHQKSVKKISLEFFTYKYNKYIMVGILLAEKSLLKSSYVKRYIFNLGEVYENKY
jgi:hypothetical protein